MANQEEFCIFDKQKHQLSSMQQVMLEYLKNNNSTMVLWFFMLLVYMALTVLIMQSENISLLKLWLLGIEQIFHRVMRCLPSKKHQKDQKRVYNKNKKVHILHTMRWTKSTIIMCL